MDVLPADRHLAYLATPDPEDRENNYINAVFADVSDVAILDAQILLEPFGCPLLNWSSLAFECDWLTRLLANELVTWPGSGCSKKTAILGPYFEDDDENYPISPPCTAGAEFICLCSKNT